MSTIQHSVTARPPNDTRRAERLIETTFRHFGDEGVRQEFHKGFRVKHVARQA
jgi:hypothetical protein